ncbi:family 4 carbohydrate esterase [Melampsora americana]|nr:family 4 carbohydrate esterase [Melampsora americana]
MNHTNPSLEVALRPQLGYVGIAVRYEPGTPSPVPGAVPLPSAKINPSDYPPPDKIPPIDSPVVQDWLKKIDMTKIPPVKPTGLEGCNNQTFNPDQIAKAGKDGNCWWSCGGCTRDDDVTVCPNKGTWGASFDDGPSEFTPSLLSYLKKENLKATFFIVGSRAIAHPVLLQTEYMESHQLCIHTWSHPSLTTLTNEQVVAEIAWSMKAFKDIIGVTPNCFRPPYGDVDDRVRYIIRSMGLTNYIWTTGPSGSFDTEDWRVVAKQVTVEETVSQWKKILSAQSNLQSGFIVLAHDLFAEAVALSINSFLPAARSIPNLKVEPISTCLGQDSKQNFFETANQGTVKVPKGLGGFEFAYMLV